MGKHAMKPFLCTVSFVVVLVFAGSALADGRDCLLHWCKVKDQNYDLEEHVAEKGDGWRTHLLGLSFDDQ